MRSLAFFAALAGTVFFIVSLGLTADGVAYLSRALMAIKSGSFFGPPGLTNGDGNGDSNLSSYLYSLTHTDDGDSTTTSRSRTSAATLTTSRFTFTSATARATTSTGLGGGGGGLGGYTYSDPFSDPFTDTYDPFAFTDSDYGAQYSSIYNSLLSSYSQQYGGLFTKRGEPTPAAQRRAPVAVPTAAPVVRRQSSSPALQKRVSIANSLSQAKSRYGAILAFWVLLLLLYVALLAVSVVFVIKFRQADSRHDDAHTAYATADPSMNHSQREDANSANSARTRLFGTFFIVYAALTGLLVLFGLLAFALFGAFIGTPVGVAAATVAFWVFSVLIAAATCVALFLDKRTSHNESLDNNGASPTTYGGVGGGEKPYENGGVVQETVPQQQYYAQHHEQQPYSYENQQVVSPPPPPPQQPQQQQYASYPQEQPQQYQHMPEPQSQPQQAYETYSPTQDTVQGSISSPQSPHQGHPLPQPPVQQQQYHLPGQEPAAAAAAMQHQPPHYSGPAA